MAYVIVVVLLLGVVLLVSGPLRRPLLPRSPGDGAEDDGGPSEEVIELQAARDAKYREIRDAELDHQTGKLSDEDYAAIDAGLRAEAIEILRDLDRITAREARQRAAADE